MELLDFVESTPYRQAVVQVMHDHLPAQDIGAEMPGRKRLMDIAREIMPDKLTSVLDDIELMEEMEYESLVNTLSMAGPFRELEKQALLELSNITDRARKLETMLEEYLEVRKYYKSLKYIRPSDPKNN